MSLVAVLPRFESLLTIKYSSAFFFFFLVSSNNSYR